MFLLNFRSIANKDGLLGFKAYLSLILNEIIEGKNKNTVHDLALERLVGYYSTYRNEGDLDFRSGEIYNEIKQLSDKNRVNLAKHFKSLLEMDVVEPSTFDWVAYIKNATIQDE